MNEPLRKTPTVDLDRLSDSAIEALLLDILEAFGAVQHRKGSDDLASRALQFRDDLEFALAVRRAPGRSSGGRA